MEYPEPKTMCYIFQLFDTDIPEVIVYKFFNSINYGYIPNYESLPNLESYGYNCEWNNVTCYLESVNDCIYKRYGNYIVGAITDEGILALYEKIPEIKNLQVYTTYPLSIQFCYKNLYNIGLTLDQILTSLMRMMNGDNQICIVGLNDIFTNNLIKSLNQLPLQFTVDNIPVIIVEENNAVDNLSDILSKCSDSNVTIFSTLIDPKKEKILFDSVQMDSTIIHFRTISPILLNQTSKLVQNNHNYVFPLYSILINDLSTLMIKAVRYTEPSLFTIIPKTILLSIFTQLYIFVIFYILLGVYFLIILLILI